MQNSKDYVRRINDDDLDDDDDDDDDDLINLPNRNSETSTGNLKVLHFYVQNTLPNTYSA